MKILSYQELNESRKNDILEKLLNNFAKNVDTTKLSNLLKSHKVQLNILVKKYVTDGVIDANRIHADIKNLSILKEERGYYDEEFDEDDNNNVILRYLYKIFIKWPRNLVVGIWDMFKETVIETFEDSFWMGILSSILWIISAIIVFLLSLFVYMTVEHFVNFMEKGVVKTQTEFVPQHTEYITQTTHVGNSTIITQVPVNVPDQWKLQVKDAKGSDRTEYWYTSNREAGTNVKIGDTISNGEVWNWGGTKNEE